MKMEHGSGNTAATQQTVQLKVKQVAIWLNALNSSWIFEHIKSKLISLNATLSRLNCDDTMIWINEWIDANVGRENTRECKQNAVGSVKKTLSTDQQPYAHNHTLEYIMSEPKSYESLKKHVDPNVKWNKISKYRWKTLSYVDNSETGVFILYCNCFGRDFCFTSHLLGFFLVQQQQQ